MVGLHYQFLERFGGVVFGGNVADAETERKARINLLAEFCSESFETRGCQFDSHDAELAGYHKLITAESAFDIGIAEVGMDQFACFFQIGRADVVTEVVVDFLEPVEIEEQDRERRFSALGEAQGLFPDRKSVV